MQLSSLKKKLSTGFNFQTLLYIVAIYLIYKIITTLKGSKDPSSNLEQSEKLNEASATISDSQARSYASALKEALVFEGFKNSWELIKPVLNKLHTSANFNKVYNAFGKIQYSPFFGNVGDPITSGHYDLLFILNTELTLSQKEEIATNYAHLKIF